MRHRSGPASADAISQYNGKVDVVNRGMGGYNSRQLLLKLKEGFVPSGPEVRLFIINIGTNDRWVFRNSWNFADHPVPSRRCKL